MKKRLPKRQEPVKGCLAGQSRGSKTVGINPGFCGRRQKNFRRGACASRRFGAI